MWKSIRGPLSKACEQFEYKSQYLALFDRRKTPRLLARSKAFLQSFGSTRSRIPRSGARRGQRRGILRLEFAKSYRESPRPILRGSTKWSTTAPIASSTPWKSSRAIRIDPPPARNFEFISKLVAALVQVHQAEHCFASNWPASLQGRAHVCRGERASSMPRRGRMRLIRCRNHPRTARPRDCERDRDSCRRFRAWRLDFQRSRHHCQGVAEASLSCPRAPGTGCP